MVTCDSVYAYEQCTGLLDGLHNLHINNQSCV